MKIIRNKQTGFSEGYGFVEFVDRATAEHAHATAARELEEEREASPRLQG